MGSLFVAALVLFCCNKMNGATRGEGRMLDGTPHPRDSKVRR